jgi:outer membrane lipoprotein SlyB
MKNKTIAILTAAVMSFGLVGCETSQGTGTLVGAGSGAALGAIAGNNISGISRGEGAIAGALVGGLLGNTMGRQQDQINAIDARVNYTTVNVRNSNGSVTPVQLRRAQGENWIGPRGEIYHGLPHESQLRNSYGF